MTRKISAAIVIKNNHINPLLSRNLRKNVLKSLLVFKQTNNKYKKHLLAFLTCDHAGLKDCTKNHQEGLGVLWKNPNRAIPNKWHMMEVCCDLTLRPGWSTCVGPRKSKQYKMQI